MTTAVLKGVLVNLNTSQFPRDFFKNFFEVISLDKKGLSERFVLECLFLTPAKFMTSEFIFCKIYSIKAEYWRQQYFIFQPTYIKSITSRNYYIRKVFQ